MLYDKTEAVKDEGPVISELDFKLNDFRQQKVLTDDDAYVRDIERLIHMRPGTFPSDPDMGIGISQYRFEDIDVLAAGELTNVIETQIRKYIPRLPLTSVNISKMKIQSGYILYIDISITSSVIKKITYAYLQNKKNILASEITIDRKKLINTEGSD